MTSSNVELAQFNRANLKNTVFREVYVVGATIFEGVKRCDSLPHLNPHKYSCIYRHNIPHWYADNRRHTRAFDFMNRTESVRQSTLAISSLASKEVIGRTLNCARTSGSTCAGWNLPGAPIRSLALIQERAYDVSEPLTDLLSDQSIDLVVTLQLLHWYKKELFSNFVNLVVMFVCFVSQLQIMIT